MSTNTIDISDVLSNIKDKDFETIKSDLDECGVLVRDYSSGNNKDENIKKLYLVVVKKEIEENNDLTDVQRQANGVIFEKETNKVVAMCQNKMQNVSDLNELNDVSGHFVRTEYCEDGTMIRLYNYNDHWYTATTRCADGRMSFWSSNKTFDEMFWETFDSSLLDNLDKSYTYTFVLLHKENKIVVHHKYNTLIYISRISNVTFQEDYKNIFYGMSRNIKRPQVVEKQELQQIDESLKPNKRGLLIKVYKKEQNKWNVYKYDFPMYKTIKEVRGNVPDIKYRYLELLNDPISLMFLEKYYPEHKFLFNMIKHSIKKVVTFVYKLYVESHIKHSTKVQEDDKYYRTLRQLHAQYKTKNEAIRYEDVEKKIYSLDKHVLKSYLDWH
jgi:hypothetical protein